MIIPPYLNPGDKIRIVSPAGKVKEEFVLPAVEWLLDKGYRVELGRHVFDSHFQFAGTDQQRLEDLQTALDDSETSAVICSRGGYGTVRIFNKLEYDGLFRHPKWLVGFSDITVLHAGLNRNRMASVHGVMPRYFLNSDGLPGESLQSLMQILAGGGASYAVPASAGNRQGQATGELVGGNLSIISGLQGTGYELNTDGKILFLEDINEFLYHVDRMMLQLKLSGKFEKMAGLVLGNFTDMKDNDSPFGKTISEIILEAVAEYDFPVCFDFPAGHEQKNLALVFGKKWELNVTGQESVFKCPADQ
ncbi:muramoyltetrapeptide carboxypeptidase [Mariniphaga anaerophila]|uniref:Muramoyltetrapeptide carboxypeptidase n=2 Tax=Mariniphaga anaerophila TaxID=1484053 RepID=A0A1M5BG25_9BACT|nr:muramoyltetrapeptide carboxypeptidase [Mariniphaga anaerophila]